MPAIVERMRDPDGAPVDILALPTDEESLRILLSDLFQNHWAEITFGPIIQGAAFEMKAEAPPSYLGMNDGYLTVAFGHTHFHLCIGPHKGTSRNPAPTALALHRRTARAELYRRLNDEGAPVSWGLRLFNGHDEQQITVLLPNPFLSADGEKVLKSPNWSRLALWDALRKTWLDDQTPDPIDRTGKKFSHG